MSQPRLAGLQPWFPRPLSRWHWWTEAIPAERVAALRIVTALVLLLDIGLTYLPHFHALFSPDALGGRDLYAEKFGADHFYWSLLRVLPDGWGPQALFAAWIVSAVGLLVGWRPLLCGLVAWACAVSVWSISPGLHNGGDRVRNSLLLMVAASGSGAVWGVSSVRKAGDARPVLVPGWPVKVLFVQLAVIYFFSGYYKLLSPIWRSGFATYWSSHDLAWSLAPAQAAWLPDSVHRLSALATLFWELGFPVLAVWRPTRAATLLIGLAFHVGTFVMLEVGCFALYSVACYTAFAPWERLRLFSREPQAGAPGAERQPPSAAALVGSGELTPAPRA